ncbi:hypothetical protein ACHZ98_17855 [Streptomyces sp. MAR4 CNY-716]
MAGIRLDQSEPQHVRLFPVTFRLVSEDARFSTYSIIEVDVERTARSGTPARSLRPDLDMLEIVGEVPAGDGWKERYRYVERLVAPSLCAIKREHERRGTSSASSAPPRSPASGWSPPNPGPPPKLSPANSTCSSRN